MTTRVHFLEYQGSSYTQKNFRPELSSCLYYFLYDVARFFSAEQYSALLSMNRKDFSDKQLKDLNALLDQIPTEFQILDKNPLVNPLDLLAFLSGRNFLTTSIEFERQWDVEDFRRQFKDMISKNFLMFCAENGNFPGRVNFAVEQLQPFDEEAMLGYLQVQGPLLVLIDGTNIQKHRAGSVLEQVTSSSDYS